MSAGSNRILRWAVLAIALLLQPVLAHAQGVQRAEVYEYGTYVSDGGVEVGTTRQGIVRSQTPGIRQIESTRTVIAQLGAEFGFRYKLIGSRPGALVPITIVAKFPPPGVLGRTSPVPILRDDYMQVTTTGKEDFLTWTFEMRSDLVPGTWTFELWSGGKKLTEQSFEVILPPTS